MSAGELIRRVGEQAQAFAQGDMTRWQKLVPLDSAFTLMPPFGGAVHGFDASPEALANLASKFRNGEARVEIVQVVMGADMALVAMIEHQHGEVHGLPDQQWPLRVTQVYRRCGEDWLLLHRHADPLLMRRSAEQTAALARGE